MKENVSALMDGELEGQAADSAIQTLRGEGEALESWRTYHLISDAMRDTRLLSAGFAARVAERLANEPTVIAPANLRRTPAKRVALAAAASVAGVGLVGWLAFAPQPQAPESLAQSEPQAPAIAVTVSTIPLPSATNDYLLAHQGFSPRVSLQGMAPYVRTVAQHPGEQRAK
ncbi:MAG TPA: sigma-E factor negative regulatory protein [Burkholderiales bacterium]|nr:sigma-E factor negative regulatory protein [Burkholderiales bacterium]